MAPSPTPADPDRSRRRLEVLAALARLRSARDSMSPPRVRGLRIRELIAARRRPVN